MEEQRSGLQLDWVKVVGGALAAMSSAVLLSTLGAAGTVIGAAVGSVVVTVGGTVYSHYLDLSRQRVASAAHAPGGPPAAAQPPEEPGVPWRDVLTGLPWKGIAVVTVGLFLAVMVAITAFELVTGRAVSTYTGGSSQDTRTSITGRDGGDGPAGDGTGPSPTVAPDSGTPSSSAPAETPTPSPDLRAPAPEETSAPTTTGTPTTSPTSSTATPTPRSTTGSTPAQP